MTDTLLDEATRRVVGFLDAMDAVADKRRALGMQDQFADMLHGFNDQELRRSDLRDLIARVQQAEAERDQLGNAAFAAYCAAGGDTDTARNWQEFFRPITLPAWSEVVEREVRQAIRDEEEEAETQAGIAAIRTAERDDLALLVSEHRDALGRKHAYQQSVEAERDSWHQAALTATAGESRAERERDEARGKLDQVREAVTSVTGEPHDDVSRDVLAILDEK